MYVPLRISNATTSTPSFFRVQRFIRTPMTEIEVSKSLATQPEVGATARPATNDTKEPSIFVNVQRDVVSRCTIADVHACVELFKVFKRHPKATIIGIDETAFLGNMGILLPQGATTTQRW
jgi:hypothetical protein